MRWRGGVLKPPDQERKKLLQRPASLEIRRLPGLEDYFRVARDPGTNHGIAKVFNAGLPLLR
jgi:hypothetical protein